MISILKKITNSDSEDVNTIVIFTANNVSYDGNGFISDEADITEYKYEINGSEISSVYGSLTFKDLMEITFASCLKQTITKKTTRMTLDRNFTPSF